MRVTRSRVDPARTDEATKLVQDIAAAVRRKPGCQSSMLGGDPAMGQAIAVSTWDTEEHARWTPMPSAILVRGFRRSASRLTYLSCTK